MTAEKYTIYSESSDMTFILEDVIDDGGDIISTEVLGFHFGEPDDESLKCIGTKAEF